MANVEDYTNGKVLSDTKIALILLRLIKIPVFGRKIKKIMLNESKKYEARLIDIKIASEQIKNSEKCAVGNRVCMDIHRNTEASSSVFLDDLAEGMVLSGKAKYITKKEAIKTIEKYTAKHPIIASKVSGRYLELCTSSKDTCIYWNMQKKGIDCLTHYSHL